MLPSVTGRYLRYSDLSLDESIGKIGPESITRAPCLRAPTAKGGHSPTRTMALPQSLRTSVIPPELELIASEQLIDIVPLVTMEKTAFISVSTLRSDLPLLSEMVRRDD